MKSFTKKVFKAVMKIPLGEVRSYKWVAKSIGRPNAARAVGQILKHNPYPVIIPCHRVISSDGKIGGYVFGKKRKKLLLDLEGKLRKDML